MGGPKLVWLGPEELQTALSDGEGYEIGWELPRGQGHRKQKEQAGWQMLREGKSFWISCVPRIVEERVSRHFPAQRSV